MAAGADTVSLFDHLYSLLNVGQSTSVVVNFIYAMFLFPSILHKVHAELNGVVGSDRLPTLQDRSNLPYLEAVWKESLRWSVPVPLSKILSFHIPSLFDPDDLL
jgi:cytochrome P450